MIQPILDSLLGKSIFVPCNPLAASLNGYCIRGNPRVENASEIRQTDCMAEEFKVLNVFDYLSLRDRLNQT